MNKRLKYIISTGIIGIVSGDTLYFISAKTRSLHDGKMYSNSRIDFKINTKTMKYERAYDGGSYDDFFNAFIRLKNDGLYILKHNDEDSRSVSLEIKYNYLSEDTKINEAYVPVIKYVADKGNNYTGIKVGGMEVNDKTVITVGISDPQKSKIAGVTGSKPSYKKNVYITVTNKSTNKNKLIWLTKYNPSNTTTIVGESRLVKLSDNRFAVLYSTTKDKKSVLNYVVVDEYGKVILRKTYKNVTFKGSTQPIVHNGAIVWTDVCKTITKRKSEWGYTYNDIVVAPALCKIPVLLDK